MPNKISQDAMNLAVMNQKVQHKAIAGFVTKPIGKATRGAGKGLISDKVNLINYNSNIASELGIKARADQQRAIEAEVRRQEAAKKVQPTVGYRESTPTKPDPLEGRRYVASKPTGIITPPMFDPSKHRGANTSLIDWDQTSRNANVTGVSGYDLPIGIITPGGYEYTLDKAHIAKGIAGASGKRVSDRVADRINISSKEGVDKGGTGEALSFVQTMGEEGANFSSPIPQFLFDMVNHRLMEGRITQKDADYITKLIQTRNPKVFRDTSEFAGFNDLGWEQFHTGAGLTGTSPGKLRIAISDVAQMETVQKLLDFNIADFKNAITADKLKGVPKGNIGSVVIQAPERGVEVIPNDLFPYKSPYSSNFTGTGIAQFPKMMSSEALFYRVLNPIKEELLERGSKIPYTSESLHRSALGAMGKRKENISQIIDPRFEDDYGNYFNELSKPNEYKEGGEVPHMMGGGGAKSKNAPKFTEAFTQGLGPMLYGAARGTAAGLAGIGGDIEELARLGINYAGDKLQSRFPNMLDKRDVVGAKATLPTSEVVLSKIPSLKDFGAGPEARHSENMASKLGMYGLSNIAAPKAGKAVVQGVNATGKALAPKAGEMLENYMMRSGMALPMDVWHGSPHRFPPTAKNPLGEFDASKIGTGEGAQAYGYGHYVAEQPLVAKDYKFMERNWFDTDVATYQGKPIQYWYDKAMSDQNLAHRTKNPKLEKDANARLAYWESVMLHEHPESVLTKMTDKDFGWPEATNYAKSVKLDKFQGIAEPGSLYKVDLPDEQIAKMLDWDKPLEGNVASQIVRAAEKTKGMNADDFKDALGLSRMYEGQPESGSSIYRVISGSLGSDAKASEWLKKNGIPGIRYLDQGSRDAGEGTRNFVVFPGNEEMLNILSREKDGGLVHGKKNGGEAKKPFFNDFERRQQMAGSVMPSQREMEEALSPSTVNSLLKRAADRRQGKAVQDEPERPEMLPEAEVWPYDPTFKQQGSAKIQQGLEAIGFPIPRARSISENVMGVLEFVPVVGTPMAAQGTKRNVERARDKGDQTGVVTELGLGALNTAASLLGTTALAKALARRIKPRTTQRYSQAEFDRILREGELKQLPAPPAPPKLLNGPTEQRLLNAPKREKTVYEMQQELAQKHAMLPKSQYGLELPPGNTAAQRLAAMEFDTPAYHSTKQDPTVLLPRPPASSRRGTDFGVHVGVNPETANGAIIPPWYEKTMRDQATRADLPASIRGESLKDIENYYKDSQVMPLLVNTGKSLEMPDLGRWNSPNNMLHNIGASSGVWPNYSLKKGVKTNDPDALNELIKNAGQAEGEKLFSEVKDELHKKAIEDMLRKRGYGSIAYPNTVEGKGDISLMFTDPDRLRSRFAAGDPFRRNAAVAAATGMAAPDLLAEEYANGGEVTSDDLILIERKR